MSKIQRPATLDLRWARYYRNSRDTNDESIERQHSTLDPYSTRQGWKVVADIEDHDISGTEVLKREGLQRLLAMIRRGEVNAIGMDTFARLLRVNSLEMGEVLAPLQRAGVVLESVAQGRLDYQTMGGRVLMGVSAEVNNAYVLNTARDVLTKHLMMARDLGSAPLPRTVYGYKRIDDPARPRDKRGKQPAAWIIDEYKAEVVRSIFKWYAEGRTPGWISRELVRRAVPTSTGKIHWAIPTIVAILDNPAYVGDRAFGRRATGKHFRLKLGEVVTATGQAVEGKKPLAECLLSTETHPAIIDRELWERVHARKERCKVKLIEDGDGRVLRREGEATTPGDDKTAFILTRLLVCGRCNSWMTGYTHGRGVKKRGYICCKYTAFGLGACVRCEVTEEAVLPLLFAELRKLLCKDRQQFLRDRLREYLKTNKTESRLPDLKKHFKEEEETLAQLRRRLGRVSEDMIPEIEEEIRRSREALATIREGMQKAEDENPVRDLETTINAACEALWHLEEAISGTDRLLLREALVGIVEKIVIHSESSTGSTGRDRYKPSSIDVVLRRGSGLDMLLDMDNIQADDCRVLRISLLSA